MPEIIQGDCLEIMRELPDNSIDLICTDPPYFKVKADWWDRQWETPSGFLKWLDSLAEQWQRILKPNGSLYCFASPKMAARVEVKIGERFNVLNNIRWTKDAGWHHKASKEEARQYQNPWESIIFAEHYGAGRILREHRQAAGFSTNDLATLFPSKTGGITGAVRNWELGNNTPTQDQWFLLQSKIPSLPDYGDLIRPFSVTADVPYTDVWNFPTVQAYPGKHPCEKPAAMLEHIVAASSRPGAVVLDCFAGSGSTLVAAKKLGRDYIGIEIDPHWVAMARQRLGDFSATAPSLEQRVTWLETQVKVLRNQRRTDERNPGQMSLF